MMFSSLQIKGKNLYKTERIWESFKEGLKNFPVREKFFPNWKL